MPRRMPDFPDSFHSWNFLSSIGSGITLLSFAVLSLACESSFLFSSYRFYSRNSLSATAWMSTFSRTTLCAKGIGLNRLSCQSLLVFFLAGMDLEPAVAPVKSISFQHLSLSYNFFLFFIL